MTNKAFYGVPAIHSMQQPRQRPHTCQFQSHNISFSVKIIIICLCWCWISKRLIQNKKRIYLTSEITWLWWYSWQHSKNHFLDLTGPGQVYILYRYILTYIAVPTTYVVTTTLQDDHECWIFFDKWLGRPWQNHPSIWLSNDCAKLHSGGPLYKVCCCWGIIKSIKLRRWLKENRVSLGRKL